MKRNLSSCVWVKRSRWWTIHFPVWYCCWPAGKLCRGWSQQPSHSDFQFSRSVYQEVWVWRKRKRSSDYQGNFVRIVGAGQIDKPNHLFVDSEDNILVADYNNKCIQVFHQNGNHIKTIGTGQILNPLGVCMDREGRIIVSEAESHGATQRISIF